MIKKYKLTYIYSVLFTNKFIFNLDDSSENRWVIADDNDIIYVKTKKFSHSRYFISSKNILFMIEIWMNLIILRH